MSTHAKEEPQSRVSETCRHKEPRKRPVIAFFDYPDVFEDFYTHYGLDQQTFATRWADTGSHAFLSVLQRELADVVWYSFALDPALSEAQHEVIGCRVKMLRSSWLHRRLWRCFYLPRVAWRWRRAYPAYAVVASYVSLFSWSFLKSLRSDKPDCFFVQDYATGRFDVLVLLARMMRIPLVTYHAGSRPEQYVGRMLKRWTIRCADHVIASSQNELEMLVGPPYRVPRNRVNVILTPIDTAVFRPLDRKEVCQLTNLEPSHRYLLFMGRLDDIVKRVSLLIRVFAELAEDHPDVLLLIAGEGPDQDRLRALAEEIVPGRVNFLGWVSGNENKTQLYNLAECLLLPSQREGFPTVVGEALCCGTPVVASRVGGVSELVVDGKTGWSFPPDDVDLFRTQLAYVLNHRDVIAEMRPQARAAAERRLSPTIVAEELGKCFGLRAQRND